MCGIAGLYKVAADASIGADLVRRMTDQMVHRGPDAEGIWVDEKRRCILGHRRLSVIDTSESGRQPMTGANGRWVRVLAWRLGVMVAVAVVFALLHRLS